MGFGILFIGLTLILTMTAYGVLPAFIGYFVSAYACKKLYAYEEKFKTPSFMMMAAGGVGIADMVLALVGFFGKDQTVLAISNAFGAVMDLILFVCALTLLPALRKIAADTEREKTAKSCTAALFGITALMAIEVAAVTFVILKIGGIMGTVFSIYTAIVPFVVLGILIALTFSCYMWICPEGEEELERESDLNRHFTSAFKRREQNDGNNERPTNKKKKKKK